jgi:hypothetical protein
MTSLLDRIRGRIKDPCCATSMGTPPQIYPPIALDVVEAAEAKLGFRLPSLLREMYTQVGNGGFGPGYGIFGLANGAPAYDSGGDEYDLVEYYWMYRGQQDVPELQHDFANGSLFLESLEQWFDKLLPICDWGCNHYSLIDCSKVEAPVIHFVGYGGELLWENASFDTWVQVWLTETFPGLEPPQVSEDELRRLVREGGIISAMLKYQEKTHCTLEEARKHIESLR